MLEKYTYIILNDEEELEARIKRLFVENGKRSRYEHICSVVERIEMIAAQYSLDRQKCFVAALLHDISTLIEWNEMPVYAQNQKWELCEAERQLPFLLHQRLSKVIAIEDFGIDDAEVLDAIAYHTSLCGNATAYQMALFVADKLAWSPGGLPPYYDKMSEALSLSLEAACYEYVKYMEDEGGMKSVHDEWKKAVIWLKEKLKKSTERPEL